MGLSSQVPLPDSQVHSLGRLQLRLNTLTCLPTGVLRPLHRKAHAAALRRGDVLDLLDDMLELRPSVFISVPRLFNRVYDRVMAAIREGNPMARRLFEAAYASKKAAMDRGDKSGGAMAPLWNRLVFSKIAARLGGALCGLHCMHASNAML